MKISIGLTILITVASTTSMSLREEGSSRNEERDLHFDDELTNLIRRVGLSYSIANKLKSEANITVTPCQLFYINYQQGRSHKSQDNDLYYAMRVSIGGGPARGQSWAVLVQRKDDALDVLHVERLI